MENNMQWKFKKNAMSQSSGEFWYDLTDGGYIKPDELLDNETQLNKLNDAIDLIISFRDALEENDLLEEL